jgi:phage gp29-like protein
MLIQSAGFQASPLDRLRLPGRYASGLTPSRMTRIFDMADNGEIGPLMELIQEIWGKDTQVGGPINTRLTNAGAVDIVVKHNPTDPDQYRAIEAAAYAESILPNLKLWGFENGSQGARYLVEKGSGKVADVIQALSIPWYYGLGVYWIIYETQYGYPKPRPTGIEFIDPRRYRLGTDDSIRLEDVNHPLGQPMREYDWYRWFSVDATLAGSRIALSGVGRALVFWWWLRISGCFDLSRYLEKFGIPNIIGEQAEGENLGTYTQDQRDELDLFLESYQSDVAALFPPGFKVQLLQAQPGGHAVFEAVNALTKSAILYGILGNEVTGSASAPGQAGVAGGQGNVGERIEDNLELGDRRRAGGGLERLIQRSCFVEYGKRFPSPLVELVPAGAAPTPQTQQGQSQPTPGAAVTSGAPAQRRAA